MSRKRQADRGEVPSVKIGAPVLEIPLRPAFLLVLAISVFVAITLPYLVVFYGAEEGRRLALAFIFAPDRLFEMWCGGSYANFSLLDRWPVFLMASTVLTAAWLAGRLALAALGVTPWLSRLERTAFALGVGLNLLSLYALAIGLAGLLAERWVFIAPIVSLVIINLVAELARVRKPKSHELNSDLHEPVASHEKQVLNHPAWLWWLAAAAPFAIAIVLGGILPPAAYDVREYHLQAPKEWFQNGRIAFLPHNIYANMPLGSELNSLWAMALAGGDDGWWWGAISGKTVMACYSLITAATLLSLGRRLHSLAAGVLAAVLFLSSPWTISLAATGYNEGPVAMYAILAIHALVLAHQAIAPSQAHRLILLAGFCAGSSVACKYPPLLFLVIPLALWVGIWPWLSRIASTPREPQADRSPFAPPSTRAALFSATLFLAAAVVACGPWFVKNWALTGNPTYPLLYPVFDGATRTPEKNHQWTRVHSPQPNAAGNRYSIADIVHQIAWLSYETQGTSVALLPLAAMAFFATSLRRTITALLLWMLFVFAAWWLFTHRLDRFLALLLPATALLAAFGAIAIQHPAWRIATLTFVGWSLISQFSFCTLTVLADNRYFAPLAALRRDDPDLFLGGLRVDAAHKWLNANLPAGSRVLLVGDAEPFDLEVPAIYNTCFDDCQFAAIFKGRTRDERLAGLNAHRISHIFFSWAHLARYRSPGNYGYTSDYVTEQLVHEELVSRDRLLKKVSIPQMEDVRGEIFEVIAN